MIAWPAVSYTTLFAHVLDGHGGSRAIDADGVVSWGPEDGQLWVHVDLTQPGTPEWLIALPGVDQEVLEALVAEDTRPRTLVLHDGVLMNLRGVNRTEDADPEDMVAVRLWIQPSCVITARRREMRTPSTLSGALDRGEGSATLGELLVGLTGTLAQLAEPVLDELEDHIDHLEELIFDCDPREMRDPLADCRQTIIHMRRFLHPQANAIADLARARGAWMNGEERESLQHVADRVTRQVEDLEAMRERASVVQDQLTSTQSAQLERRMFLVSIIATLFLPLTLVSGLLGANVGGIPLANSDTGFWVICAITLILGAVQWIVLRRLKWI